MGHGSAIVKIDPRIRKYIIDNGRILYLDCSSIHVKDQLHLMQCFVCQGFGHKKGSPHCTEVKACLYCAKDHDSRDCPVKRNFTKHNCANCKNSNDHNIRREAQSHTSTSNYCPLVQRELLRVINRTAGIEPKNFPHLMITRRTQNR